MELPAPVKHNSGFSLVELLLALAVGTIVALSVYNMFWASLKLDDRMRRVHDNYVEVLIADQALTRDLENAIDLDLSGSYPGALIFEGQKTEVSFLTQTPNGIKHVRYYSGFWDKGPAAKRMIGRVVNPSKVYSKKSLPIEFLLRQESSLADWLNETSVSTSTQMVAAGLKKGSFNCQYAPFAKDLHTQGAKELNYEDSWNSKGLPLSVRCSFILYDPKKPQEGLMFKRDIFLAPVPSYHHEQ